MKTVSQAEAQRRLPDLIAETRRMPIVLEENGKVVAALVRPEDYEIVRRVRLAEMEEVCRQAGEYAKEQGLTEELLNELLNED